MTRQETRIYFNEYNPLLGNAAYLPVCSGKLHAYAFASERVKSHYSVARYLYHIDAADTILAHYENPGVVAFSAMMWNEQLSLHVAREVKKRWPDCLIIFGGTQVPHNPTQYFKDNPFIDLAVRGEGEIPFREILERNIDGRDFSNIPGVSWHDADGTTHVATGEAPFEKDLDVFPSPYLLGYYDDLIQSQKNISWQAIIETNRGCPFSCCFCYWGKGGLSRKYRFYSMERVTAEFEWIGKNKIAFVYNADSNFGMHKRDEEIAALMVKTKQTYGFPEKVVNLYGKNTDERIFNIAKLLYTNGMHKGLGLSRQSLDEAALENSKRSNIKLSVYKSLQTKFEDEGIPTFTELIIGLPGETYDSFKKGVGEILHTSLRCQLIIFLCEVYLNTEMGNPEYQEKFKVVKQRNVGYGVHSIVHDQRWITEYIDYVIGTYSMPVDDWKRTGVFAWTTMTMTSLRLCFYMLQYLHTRYGTKHLDFIEFVCEEQMKPGTGTIWREELEHYRAFMQQIVEGKGRAVLVPGCGDIYWAIEEASFLRLTAQADKFSDEMYDIIVQYLQARDLEVHEDELKEVVRYQRLRTPTFFASTTMQHTFKFNFPEFFDKWGTEKQVPIEEKSQHLVVREDNKLIDRVRFAQERLLWGRRGGKFERPVEWQDVDDSTRPMVTKDGASTGTQS